MKSSSRDWCRQDLVSVFLWLFGGWVPFGLLAPYAWSQDVSQAQRRSFSAPRGTPVIDAKPDEVWKGIKPITIDQLIDTDPALSQDSIASAKLRACWDEQHLYLWIDVTDAVISNQNPASWEQDSCEVFLDELRQRNNSYDDDDGQYRIAATGQVSQGESTQNAIKAEVLRTADGYLIEAAIPWRKLKPEVGTELGFEAQLNDDAGAGHRQAIRKWNEASNDSWRNTAGFGTLILSDHDQTDEAMPAKNVGQPEPASRSAADTQSVPASLRVPEWAKDAVFYQIFPERFRNGDPDNDPNHASIEFPDVVPATWQVTPWTQEWYARSPWETKLGTKFFEDGVFHRRYGGDLQGVLDKLDYLNDLGINVIYFNPVFYARSLHKYDGNSFHHIDPHFGPDPAGDFAIMAKETADPTTWQWTAADKLFLDLIQQAKSRGIRIIIDGVFNHTGRDFFAFDHIRKNQQKSPYVDWYTIRGFDDPKTPENEFKYDGWWGVDTLPEFANNASGTDLHPAPKAYIMEATRRWMDPNRDGDPSDGIDGWRLDVANEVPNQFWRDWHQEVRKLNSQAFTTAEIWDEASNYLADCGFSATMNYFGFAYPTKGFLIDGKLKASDFVKQIQDRMQKHPAEVQFALQNLIDSHDTDRLASMIVNADRNHPYVKPEKHDYDVGERVSPRHFENYDVIRPTVEQFKRLRLFALFQFTFVGPPMIYYGTEAGMDGADDPCCRMPMVWDDLEYQPRTMSPKGPLGVSQPIKFDAELHDYYRRLVRMRRDNEVLRRGGIRFLHADDESQTLIYSRGEGQNKLLVAINRGAKPAEFYFESTEVSGELTSLLHTGIEGTLKRDAEGYLISLPAVSGQVWRMTKSGE